MFLQLLYENMKIRVENVVDKGSVNGSDYNITDEHEVGVFNKWTDRFISQDHPSIIQAGSFTFRFHKLLNYITLSIPQNKRISLQNFQTYIGLPLFSKYEFYTYYIRKAKIK